MMYTEKQLLAFRNFRGTLDEFKETIKQVDEPETIINIVYSYMDADKNMMSKKTRRREIVFPRQLAHWAMYYFTFMSLRSIGDKIGGKDHATVLHSFKIIDDLCDVNRGVRIVVSEIESLIENAGIGRKFERGEDRFSKW